MTNHHADEGEFWRHVLGGIMRDRDAAVRPAPELQEPTGWMRERLWKVPADTLLSVREASEAIGKSLSAVYKLAQRHRLPSRRAKLGHSPKAGPALYYRAADLRRFMGDD